jgi:hypothetical protein
VSGGESRSDPNDRSDVPAVVVGIVVGVSIVTVILIHPGFGQFSGTVYSEPDCDIGCIAIGVAWLTLPPNTLVTLRWTDTSGGLATFHLWSQFGTVCQETGTHGTCVFSSPGEEYTVVAENVNGDWYQQIDYSGYFS